MKKNLGFTKEKIKNICLKLFNLGKKHKVLSTFLCLLIIVFCFKSIVWIYNDIAYGRFEKVGGIKNARIGKDIRYSPAIFFETGKKLFVLSPIKKDGVPSYEIYEITQTVKKKNSLLEHALNIIPLTNKNGDVVFFLNNIFGEYNFSENCNVVYKYDYTNDALKRVNDFNIVNANGEKFKIGASHNNPNFINLKNGKTLLWSVALFNNLAKKMIICDINKETCTCGFDNIQPIKVMELDKENLLIYGYIANNYDKKNIYKYNLNTNKFYKLYDVTGDANVFETSDIFVLNDNQFVVLKHNKFGKIKKIQFVIYQIKKNTILPVKAFNCKMNNLFDYISGNNIVLINHRFLLFVGGGISFWNHSSFINKVHLCDLINEKFYTLNNFPYNIAGQTIFVTSDNQVYLAGGEYCRNFLFFKKYSNFKGVYKFVMGKKLKNMVK